MTKISASGNKVLNGLDAHHQVVDCKRVYAIP